MELANKTAVFIGGFGGIGSFACRELLSRGLKGLMVLDNISEEQGCDQIQELSSIEPCASLGFKKLDLNKGASNIRRTLHLAAEKFSGTFDLLINGSGNINDRNVSRTININLLSVIEATLIAVPIMSRCASGRGGMIVNIASVLGLEPAHFLAVHTASKHGVIGFTKSMAHKHYLEVTGITHVAFCPGFTKTKQIECFDGKDTFDYSKPITDKFAKSLKLQKAEQCGRHLVCCIERAQNGSIWLSDQGEMKEVRLHYYWRPQFDDPKKC